MGKVPAPGDVIGPTGPHEIEWLSVVDTADEAELLQHPQTFFTLWTRDPGPLLRERLLRAVPWQEAQGRPPSRSASSMSTRSLPTLPRGSGLRVVPVSPGSGLLSARFFSLRSAWKCDAFLKLKHGVSVCRDLD